MNQLQLRTEIIRRMHEDLVGPTSSGEVLEDRPTDRYLTGILYPAESEMTPQDDDAFPGGGGGDAEASGGADVEGAVPLLATLKPSSAGVSFCVRTAPGTRPTIDAHIRCGTYVAEGTKSEGETRRRWTRVDHDVHLPALEITADERKVPLADQGLPGLELYFQVARWEASTLTVTVAMVNRQSRGSTRTESEERSFFQCELAIQPGNGCELVARPSRVSALDQDGRVAALIYRDAKELATGHTCAATWDVEKERVTSVRTTWLPEKVVLGVDPQGDRVFASLGDRLSATWLSSAGPNDLAAGLQKLIDAYSKWIEQERARIPPLLTELRDQAEANMVACERGAERMRRAVELLVKDEAVRVAFQHAQSAMVTQRRWSNPKEKDLGWRPFQLGFQLIVLESLANRDSTDRRLMDLLWFPTGGGKTEAYLALTAFVLMLRRLRATGKDDGAGTAILMRYTLRLLTVQQFQRAATMICACENLRRRDPQKRLGSVPFSIGLWVGNSTTPGTLEDAISPKGSATHKQISGCPCCGGAVKWALRRKDSDVQCIGDAPCALRETDPRLPIWTIDEDIYREAPSLVIATVDKFAQVVRNPSSGVFFAVGSVRAPPDLIIQDELHLISGPLGSMTGLYEAAIDELCGHRGTYPKLVGSTATIRRAEDQVRALFARTTFQFPPPGLDSTNSGFSVEDKSSAGRLYVGITTAGRSAKFAVQATAALLLQAAVAPGATPDDRDPYTTLVGYFNTLRELGGSLVLMQDDVPYSVEQYAARRGEQPRVLKPPAELTSRLRADEIRHMLDSLEKKHTEDDSQDILLASNMISVGVDVQRLGLMMVVGQPKTVAEYIQATSRVGRRSPGIVVALYNAGRVRDRARFETFRTWHDTLYREVEATSVTPFASRALDKALHAALVALVRHLVPGMQRDPPRLSLSAKAAAELLVQKVEARVRFAALGDSEALRQVGSSLRRRLEVWADRDDLEKYWEDWGEQRSLLISAEQYAASMQAGKATTRALWPTPNSMREVEPGTPFRLVEKLHRREGSDAE